MNRTSEVRPGKGMAVHIRFTGGGQGRAREVRGGKKCHSHVKGKENDEEKPRVRFNGGKKKQKTLEPKKARA